jgi:hypothetical protein
VSFTVNAPPAKAGATAGPATSATSAAAAHEGIEVEGLDASAWSLSTDSASGLKVEAAPEGEPRSESASASPSPFVHAGPATGAKEYKILTPRDKIFDGRFDLARLEEALNQYGKQGWVVRAVTTPHIKGFSGALEETIVVLLER